MRMSDRLLPWVLSRACRACALLTAQLQWRERQNPAYAINYMLIWTVANSLVHMP